MNLSVHNQSPSSAPSEQARERWLNTLSQKAKNLNGTGPHFAFLAQSLCSAKRI